MQKTHHYSLIMKWTGNRGEGTKNYRSYERAHVIYADGKPEIPGSSDPAFRGDKTRYNPEEMLVASLSSCHMLWYLHLCAVNGITVVDYVDQATGTMIETDNGGGRFSEVILRPVITILEQDKMELAESLHREANALCFIANSCNFPVLHQAEHRVG